MPFKCWLVLALLIVLAGTAWADPAKDSSSDQPTLYTQRTSSGLGWQGWGLRAGLADNADQVVGGAHFNMGEIADHLRFQPDVLLGTGDNVTTLYGTAPLYYRFGGSSGITPYAGGGLALGFVDVDAPAGSSGDDSSFEIGARATGGLEWPRGGGEAFFVELSLGFGDVHDAQIVAAWTF